MGECFFWYRPTRVVPDQRPLNGCLCVCVCVCVLISLWQTLAMAGSYVNSSLRPKSETLQDSEFGLKLKSKTLVSAKDKVTHAVFG